MKRPDWKSTRVSPRGTHHLAGDGSPLYAERFDSALKFQGSGFQAKSLRFCVEFEREFVPEARRCHVPPGMVPDAGEGEPVHGARGADIR